MSLSKHPGNSILDCHFHVIGDGKVHPYRADMSYEPPVAPVETVLALHDRVGVTHGVAVQVSVYGEDNGLLVETLTHHRERFRGVAVTGASASDGEIAALRDAGVVGLRLNLVHGGGPDLSTLERYGALCRDAGLHLQIYLDGRLLPQLGGPLSALGVPLVFDHFGGIPADLAAQGHPAVETLAGLLSDGAWVKLSAPYRVSAQRSGFRDVAALGRRLIEAAPERCIWGSDWPHVATDRHFTVAALLDLVDDMTGDAALSGAILCDNAKQLYGF